MRFKQDEINFHGFMKAQRELQERTLSEVGRGLYSESMLYRIELGERLPNKLERDRIVARLGVSGEGHEDYLSLKEYRCWEQRQELIRCIEERDFTDFYEKLENYGGKTRTKVEKQFLAAMEFMMLQATNAPLEEQRTVIEKAVRHSMPNPRIYLLRRLLLCSQEVNLLIEYIHIYDAYKSETKLREWRLERYEEVLLCIERSCMDDTDKAKVYPKLAYYYCLDFGVEIGHPEGRCLELCNEAIELLRDTRKLYYMVELLELRATETDILWANTLKALYEEYHVPAYMQDSCHLYWESESYLVNEIIRTRREMFGLFRWQLAEGYCTERSLTRIETEYSKPQMYVLNGLFERLGLRQEYMRTRVITNEAEVLKSYQRLRRAANDHNYDTWEKELNFLEENLCLDIIQNRQIYMHEKALFDLATGKISKAKAVHHLINAMELTVPFDAIVGVDESYLTREEMSCLYAAARRIDDAKLSQAIEKVCWEEIDGGRLRHRLSINEVLMTGVSEYLGNNGELEKSSRISSEIITAELRNRRMATIVINMYIKYWNFKQINDNNKESGQLASSVLKHGLCICDITKNIKYKECLVSLMKD